MNQMHHFATSQDSRTGVDVAIKKIPNPFRNTIDGNRRGTNGVSANGVTAIFNIF